MQGRFFCFVRHQASGNAGRGFCPSGQKLLLKKGSSFVQQLRLETKLYFWLMNLRERGVWYILDGLDKWLFDGSHFWTAILGVVVGLLILYLPDKDLKEIEKL